MSTTAERRCFWRASPTHYNRMELIDKETHRVQAIIVPSPHWNSYYWQRFANQEAEGLCSLLSEAKAEAELALQNGKLI